MGLRKAPSERSKAGAAREPGCGAITFALDDAATEAEAYVAELVAMGYHRGDQTLTVTATLIAANPARDAIGVTECLALLKRALRGRRPAPRGSEGAQ